MNKILFALVSCMASVVYCGGGGGEHKVHFKAEYPYHTIHKHHTEKIPDVKIIKVPVVKEVKVLEPYKVPYKVKVPYLVKQHIHTVVKETHNHPVHTSEHVHHKPTHHKSHAYDDHSQSYGSHAASDVAPLYVSHSPVHQSSYDSPASYTNAHHSMPNSFYPVAAKDSYPAFTHDFHSRHHSSAPANLGFGSSEGKAESNYEVKESGDMGPVLFGRFTKSLSPGKMTEAMAKSEAYPYPLPQDEAKAAEYLFGFDPKASSYDFTDL